MSYLRTRTWVGMAVIVGILLVGGGLWVQRSAAPAERPIPIGALFPMTGGLSQYGDVASKSSILAVEEINRDGGVNGRLLTLDVQDHQCQPAKAVAVFKDLTSLQGIRFFLAAGCSGTALAVNPLLDKEVLLGSAISSPKVSGTSPRFFRNYGTDSAGTKLFAAYIQEQRFQSVGVLYEDTDYAKGLMLSLKEYLTSSGLPFMTESFTSDSVDMRTQLTKLKASNPEVLFLSPQTVTTANIALKQMQELGYAPKQLIVNENVLKSEQLRTTYPDLLNGAIGADFKVQDSQGLTDFLQAYKVRFGTDCAQTNICATSYDNVRMLAEALRTVGDDDGKIAEYLKNISYTGISGQVTFTDKNDRSDSSSVLFKIEATKPVAQE